MVFQCAKAINIYANVGQKAGDTYIADYILNKTNSNNLLFSQVDYSEDTTYLRYIYGFPSFKEKQFNLNSISKFAKSLRNGVCLPINQATFLDRYIISEKYIVLIPLRTGENTLGFILLTSEEENLPQLPKALVDLLIYSFQQQSNIESTVKEPSSKLKNQKDLIYKEVSKAHNIELSSLKIHSAKLQDYYQFLFESSPVGKIVIRGNGEIIGLNSQFRKWFEVNEDNYPLFLSSIAQNNHSSRLMHLVRETFRTEITQSATLKYFIKNDFYYFETKASKITTTGGEAIIQITMVDITPIKKAQSEAIIKNIEYLKVLEDFKQINHELAINQEELHVKVQEIDALNKELESNRKLLIETGISAKVGGWEYIVGTKKINCTEETLKIHGLSKKTKPTLENILSLYDENNQQNLVKALGKCLKTYSAFSLELQLILQDNTIKWVRVNGKYEDVEGVRRLYGSIQDITERKLKQERIEQLSELFELSPDLLTITNLDGAFVELNPAWEKILGYTVEELKSKPLSEFIHPNDLLRTKENTKAVEGKENNFREFVNRYKHKDGSYRWLSWKCIQKNTDKSGLSFSAIRDITEEIKANEELYKLSLIVKYTNHIVIFTDRSGKIEWVNEGFEEVTGYTIDEIRGNKPGEILQGKETSKEEIRKFGSAVKKGEPFSTVIVNYKKSGEKYWAEIDMRPIKNENGETVKFFSVQKDVTRRVMAENKFIEQKNRLDLATKTAGLGIWDWNITKDKILCTKKTYEICGISRYKESCCYNDWIHLIHLEDRDTVEKALQYAIENEQELDIEFRVNLPNNTVRYLKSIAKVQAHLEGNDTRMLGVLWDITNQKQNEIEIQNLNSVLEEKVSERTLALAQTNLALIEAKAEIFEAYSKEKEISQLKSRFVATASHQFRTPLTVIKSNVDIMEMFTPHIDKNLQNRFKKSFDRINQETGRMTDMMNDVLTLEKINAGAITLNKDYVNVTEILNELIIGMNEVSKFLSKIHMQVIGEEKKTYLDKDLFMHCIINILNNAQKYSTSNLPILVTIEFHSKYLKIATKDQGIGMSKEDLNNIFQPFYRGKNTEGIQGTGLGMSIIQEYISLNNGKIDIESELNKGTNVTLIFPDLNA